MRRRFIVALLAAGGILVGCGAGNVPSAAVTVSATVTAPTTLLQTTTVVAGTKTVSTTISTTKTASTTVIAKPDTKTGAACLAVGAQLSSIDILAAMQKWSGGGSLKVDYVHREYGTFTEIPHEGRARRPGALDHRPERGRCRPPVTRKIRASGLTWWTRHDRVGLRRRSLHRGRYSNPRRKDHDSRDDAEGHGHQDRYGRAKLAPVGGFSNGDFIIGEEIPPGIYKCDSGAQLTSWKISPATGEQEDFDISTIAFVPETGYSVSLSECNGNWLPRLTSAFSMSSPRQRLGLLDRGGGSAAGCHRRDLVEPPRWWRSESAGSDAAGPRANTRPVRTAERPGRSPRSPDG